MPGSFLEEVRKKVQDISGEGEEATSDHESHEVFNSDMDGQLLLWLNRLVLVCEMFHLNQNKVWGRRQFSKTIEMVWLTFCAYFQ